MWFGVIWSGSVSNCLRAGIRFGKIRYGWVGCGMMGRGLVGFGWGRSDAVRQGGIR